MTVLSSKLQLIQRLKLDLNRTEANDEVTTKRRLGAGTQRVDYVDDQAMSCSSHTQRP